MTPELNKQITKVQAEAKEQSDKWWNIIYDDESFEPYTDADQSTVDGIVKQYNYIIYKLLQIIDN